MASVLMKEGIMYIGGGAFENVASLKTLELPKGLKIIVYKSFHETSIEKVDSPSILTSIRNYVFPIGALKKMNELLESLAVINPCIFSKTKIKD